jgi:integrase
MTGLFAGLRWGESAALRWSDIDWARGYVHVQRTVSDRRRIEPVKDGEPRRVKLSPGLLEALRSHREAMALEGHVQGWSAESRDIAFPTSAGNRLAYAFFVRVWRDLLATAGLTRRPYHATRHSYATILLESGADIRFVQRQLGHATIGLTVDTYGHVDPERHASVVEAFDRCLAETPTRHPAPPRAEGAAEGVDSAEGV